MSKGVKHDRTEITTTLPNTRRKRKSRSRTKIVCHDDTVGPRIPTLFLEFAASSPIAMHMDWLHNLELSCEKQRCFAATCKSRTDQHRKSSDFAWAHGAKTLVNGINMFLTYHIPRYYTVASDEEWRSALAALRSFHDYCVRRRYVKDDPGLKLALHRLNKFQIVTILARLQDLIEQKWWDSVEDASGSEHEGARIRAEGGDHGTVYEAFVGSDVPLCVEQILQDGWLISEDSYENSKALLSLPPDVAALAVKGMSFSCMSLGLRNEVWRPVQTEGGPSTAAITAYPPDDVFID